MIVLFYSYFCTLLFLQKKMKKIGQKEESFPSLTKQRKENIIWGSDEKSFCSSLDEKLVVKNKNF